MSNEKGIFCIKGYGMISFVVTGTTAWCPVSGAHNCSLCEVIPKEEALKQKQVKRIIEEEE